MSKRGVKLDDVIEAVQDQKVLDTLIPLLHERLFEQLNSIMESMFTKYSESLTAKLESLVEKSTTEAVSRVAAALDHKINQLEQKNRDLTVRVDDLEN